jgi:hypothetical protein
MANLSAALFPQDSFIMVQQQLSTIMQLIGVGGSEFQQRLQVLAQQVALQATTMQELEQLKVTLSTTDMSMRDKWVTLNSWTQHMQTHLTILCQERPAVIQSLHEVLQRTSNMGQALAYFCNNWSVLQNAFQNLKTQMNNSSEALQAQLTQTDFNLEQSHHSLKEQLDQHIQRLETQIMQQVDSQGSNVQLLSQVQELQQQLKTQGEHLQKWDAFWTKENVHRNYMEKQISLEKSHDRLCQQILQSQPLGDVSDSPMLSEFSDRLTRLTQDFGSLQHAVHVMDGQMQQKQTSPLDTRKFQELAQGQLTHASALEKLQEDVTKLATQPSPTPTLDHIIVHMRREWHKEKQVLLAQAKQELLELMHGRAFKNIPAVS